LRYFRRIHEQLAFKDKRILKLMDATGKIVFFHDGYMGEIYEEKKNSRRNLILLEKELEDHPGEHDIMGYLGDEYASYGEKEKAKEWYRRSVEHMPEILPEIDQRDAQTFCKLIGLYAAEGNFGEAEKIYGRAEKAFPEDGDFDYELGCYCASAQRWEEGAKYLAKGLLKLEKYGTSNKSMDISADIETVYGNLALCFLRSGKPQEAVQTAVGLLKVKPYDMKALYILLQAFLQDGGGRAGQEEYMEAVAGFLGKLYQLSEMKDRLFIARTAEEAGWGEFGAYINKKEQ